MRRTVSTANGPENDPGARRHRAVARLARAAAIAGTLAVSGLALSARAQEASWLPDDATVRALESHPAIAEALARREAGHARAAAIRRGPQETVVRSMLRERYVRDLPDRYGEGEIALERPLRLGAKADADAALGDTTRRAADIELADARHELARALLAAWFELLRARAELDSALAAQEQATTLARAVATRVRRGDAALVDQELAEADAQRQQASVEAARTAERAAAAMLARRFPQVGEPGATPAALPAIPEGDEASLRTEYVEESHERRLAIAESERAAQAARRASLDRRPDPTVGVFVGVDRGGLDRLAGVNVSVPLPGSYRESNAMAAAAEASALRARAEAVSARLAAEFDALWANAVGRRAAAESLDRAARSQAGALARTRRGYEHGELGIAEVLAAQRAAREVAGASRRGAIDASEAALRLQLDLHRIWDFD